MNHENDVSPLAHESETPSIQLADDVLIILPVRNLVLYPGIVHPVTIGRPASLAAAQEAARTGRPIGLLLQKDAEQEDPAPEDLYLIGTLAHILRYVTAPDGKHHLVCQGDARFRVIDFIPGHPFLLARIERLESRPERSPGLEARLILLKQKATEALELLPQTPTELVHAVQSMESAGALADLVAGYLDLKPDQKQALLEQTDVEQRVDAVLEHLSHRVEVMRLTRQISERTKEQIDSRQREALLREQMRSIQKELGEGQEREDELRELREAIAAAGMPEEVLAAAAVVGLAGAPARERERLTGFGAGAPRPVVDGRRVAVGSAEPGEIARHRHEEAVLGGGGHRREIAGRSPERMGPGVREGGVPREVAGDERVEVTVAAAGDRPLGRDDRAVR